MLVAQRFELGEQQLQAVGRRLVLPVQHTHNQADVKRTPRTFNNRLTFAWVVNSAEDASCAMHHANSSKVAPNTPAPADAEAEAALHCSLRMRNVTSASASDKRSGTKL